MAITAAVTLADTTLLPGQKAQATLTVSNSGGSDVLVTGIQVTVSPRTSAVGVGTCIFGGAGPQTVPASGSEEFYFDLVAHAPQAENPKVSPSSFAYVIGAVVNTNDGAITTATTDTLTVSAFIT